MKQMTAAFGLHSAQQGHAEQGQVANNVENLVTHELIGPAQTRFIQHTVAGQNDRVIERAAANQVCASQRFDFFDKAKCSGGSDLSSKRTVTQSDRAMLHTDKWMRKECRSRWSPYH